MRISLVIVVLAAVTVGMVHLRRAETRVHHQVHRLQVRQIRLRRALYDQQAILGCLTAPGQVRRRAELMDARLTDQVTRSTVAHGAGDGRR